MMLLVLVSSVVLYLLHLLDGILLSQGSEELKRLPTSNRTLAPLRQAIQSSNATEALTSLPLALAWCYLGLLLENKERFSTTLTGIPDCGFSETDPLDCFGKAIETVKDNPPVLNRLAKIFHFLSKQEMAEGICNMALDVPRDPQLHWQAYCTWAQVSPHQGQRSMLGVRSVDRSPYRRDLSCSSSLQDNHGASPRYGAMLPPYLSLERGTDGLAAFKDPMITKNQIYSQGVSSGLQIHMKMYPQDLECAKMGQGPVPDRRKLTHAENDLERVLKVCPCLRTNLDMGQVSMGTSYPSWTPCENCSWWMKLPDKAMEFDLADTIPELQLFRGKCLWLKSQETLAIECFRQAIELDDVGSTESLRCLPEPLLLLFGQKKLKTEMLMQEMERVKKAEEKFPRQHLQQELRAVCCNRTLEVTQLSKAVITRGRMALVKLLFETMKVDSSKGRVNEQPLSLRVVRVAAGSAQWLSLS
ncbi:LOW QUALITY PROTEIN: tetratricopeptide repeat protein 22 [Spheniscus humboldti]